MSMDDVSNRSGYGEETIKNMRHPRARGSGLNPSMRMMIDIAQSVGLNIVAVPIKDNS